MSDHSQSQGDKPFFNDTVLTYFGVLGAVAIAIAVFFGAIAYSTPSAAEDVSEDLIKARVSKREEVNGAAKVLLSSYGKNSETSYRIPVAEAEKILVSNPAALNAARGVAK